MRPLGLALLAALAIAPVARADTQDTVQLAGEAIGAFVGDLTEPRIDANCVELNGGLAGFAGGHESEEQELIRKLTPDKGNGLSPGDRGDGPADLPAHVYFKTTTESFNRRYVFVARGGQLYFKSNAEVTHIEQPYKRLGVPRCFAGDVRGISLDDDELIAIDSTRRVFTMDGALGDPALFNWTMRWGAPFWQGGGWHIPAHMMAWAWSVVSIPEDGTYKDGAGYDHRVGEAKVSHVWMLNHNGQRLTYIDPWLASDESYEMCGPLRGRFQAVNLSASGSEIFVIGRHGDLFTRVYDFDLSGHDAFFMNYSYEDQRGKGDGSPIQLPAEPWTRQPKIDGKVTSAISISKRGRDAVHATLRVEGRRKGHTGYWQRDVAAPRKQGWRVHRTDAPLEGEVLRNPGGNTSKRGLAPSEDMKFVMKDEGMRAVIPDFNTYCTPAHIEIHEDGRTRTVTFHHVDGLRQVERARGLDDDPRLQFGALEWPSGKIDQELQVFATTDAIEIPALGWTFERKP